MVNDLYENDLMSEISAQLLVNTEPVARRYFPKKNYSDKKTPPVPESLF